MIIPFLDLKKANAEIEEEIFQAIKRVLDSGWYILGKAGEAFERNMKIGLAGEDEGHVISCNSGTDAIILSLLAAGVEPGDEVITVSHTAIPTICAICSVGARPVYVDIDSESWIMDISSIEPAITEKTKAIVPVHLYGNMVAINDLRTVLEQIGRPDVHIIEDVAQAHGSKLLGKQAGTLGRFGAFSFYPSKNIGALGDGGAVFCHASNDMEYLKMLRNYGQKDRYYAEVKRGINSRLDELQAAILDVKLKYLNEWNYRKSQLVNAYRKELSSLPITFQKVTDGCEPGWHLCVIATENRRVRDDLVSHLKRNEINTLIHYPIPNHQQKAFLSGTPSNLPVTENLVSRIISLPLNIAIIDGEQHAIIEAIQAFFRN